jgi:ABC-type transporter Mla subunit MlaD
MDPNALKATLARLGESMPGVAPGVDEALASGSVALRSAARLAAETRSTPLPEQAMARVGEALTAFTVFAGERRAALDGAFTQVQAKVDALVDLDEHTARVESGVATVETSFAGCRDKLADGTAGAQQAAAAFGERVEQLLVSVEEGQEELALSLEVANAAFLELQEGLERGEQAVLAELDVFVDELVAREDEAVAATDDYVARAFQSSTVMVDNLVGEYPDSIGADVARALEEVQGGIQEYIQGLVKRAMDDVLGSLQEFEKKIEESEKSSEQARKLLEPLFEEFGRLAEPLVKSLDSIRDAGRTVGVDF